MKWKIGDKVKFLNEAGGGYVTEIMSPGMVKVSNEDGFEIPYPVSDLLRLATEQDDDAAAKFFDEEYSTPPELLAKAAEEATQHSEQSSALFRRQSMHIKEGIYLAFVPQDQKWLTSGLMDIYLLNHSKNDILFAFFQEADNKVSNKDYDVIGAHNKYLIDTIERSEIETYTHGHLQAIIIAPEAADKLVAPLNKHYSIKASKLFQEGAYKFIDILNQNAFIAEMGNMEYLSIISKALPKANAAADAHQRAQHQPAAKERSLIEYHKVAPLEAEVDLHISALMDDFSHLKAHDILQKQLDYFNRCLEDAMRHQYKKLVFIHGIGNGTLKKQLKDELRDYDEIEVRDASFQRYGYGAIEIQIHYA